MHFNARQDYAKVLSPNSDSKHSSLFTNSVCVCPTDVRAMLSQELLYSLIQLARAYSDLKHMILLK